MRSRSARLPMGRIALGMLAASASTFLLLFSARPLSCSFGLRISLSRSPHLAHPLRFRLAHSVANRLAVSPADSHAPSWIPRHFESLGATHNRSNNTGCHCAPKHSPFCTKYSTVRRREYV